MMRLMIPKSVAIALAAVCLGYNLLAPSTAAGQQVPEGFSIESVAGRLDRDTMGFAFLPDGRILLIQKETGTVKLLVEGIVRTSPVLTVERLQAVSERGLLGIAVDPDWPDSSFVYLYHTRNDSTNRVTRFTALGELTDPASDDITLDPQSAKTLIFFPDTTRFHNAGTLRFGKDKTLYISHGDDAYADRVQSLTNPYGKIFRIERDGGVPPDNPAFPEAPADAMPQTYAFGLRNPFRFNIDPANGALFIGDVGTTLFEELNVSYGGENFGYPHYEGEAFFRPYVPLIPPDPTFPVLAYANNRGAGAASAIALVAYRPVDYPNDSSFPPEYSGAYFHSDFFDDELRFLRMNEMSAWESFGFASGFSMLVDGTIGADGSIYVLEYGGELFRIAHVGPTDIDDEGAAPVAAARLDQNFPNPFSDDTTISFSLTEAAEVSLAVVDLLGREVRTRGLGMMPPGVHQLSVSASGLAAGVYVYRLEAGGFTDVKRMVVAR